MDNETLLISRFSDLSDQAGRWNTYTFSGFLSLPEQDLLLKLKNELKSPSALWGPSASSERKIAVFGSEDLFGYPPEYPVTVLKITPASVKFAEDLTHRDYLGAILNTGIDRSLTGDIVIRDKTAWLVCLDSIADFLVSSITRIRHTTVSAEKISGEIPELEPELSEIRFNVASERLDAVAAAFTGQSRAKASDLFVRELVFVNSRVVTDPSAHLKEGDILNIRGYGKAVYRGIGGQSKKGRLYVVLDKYI